MKDTQIPCKDCICLAMCKSYQVRPGSIIKLMRKCSILKEYVVQQPRPGVRILKAKEAIEQL